MTRSGHQLNSRLIVMTRFPRPGHVKTRLIGALGDEGAAALHTELARHCVRRMHAAALGSGIELVVRATGGSAGKVRRWLERGVRVRDQREGDLGTRLATAARGAFDAGAGAAVLVGSDAPGVGGVHVRAALDALAQHDVVLGPAMDGGYYLVALAQRSATRSVPALLGPQIPWGTSGVLEASLAAARSAGLSAHLLDPLADIDRPEDIAIWTAILDDEERTRRDPRLSVVIPALNEEDGIAAAVACSWAAGAHEVIVADGGSTDRTAEIALAANARIVRSARGRAVQMNAGATETTGDILLFLHADTSIPADSLDSVRSVMAHADTALGAFRFAAGDPDSAVDRLITAGGVLRHRVFRLPYGDQALFVRARDFADLGGFPVLPVMEDHEFARRCRLLGRLETAPLSARSSARAWHRHGLLETTLTNAAVIAGYRVGVPAQRLAAWRSRIAERLAR
ncbi:MAG: TIGR04283 family arsenosugar biosynthesis glycosyltransferase [Coriobacteriia bacterium]|nr:TIGR04283 family arsenosugar biosynthesis glycosyltransferase [Coriobacteriia bacterium]